jgi:mono/diheme cytochrome c family protein
MLMQCLNGVAVALALILLLPISSASAYAQADPQGYYTKTQADAGQAVFNQVCAICHGDHLQGGVGPALAGKEFLSVSQFQQVTAEYFYHFMSTHMPLNAPGSLSKTQYLNIMAYFLEANGYSSGSQPLTANDEELKGIKIEPQH